MKKSKINRIIDFSFRLLVILSIAISIQMWIYSAFGHVFFSSALIVAYGFNFFFAFAFVILVELFEEKVLPHLGNAFLGFSLLKFLVFLVVLYPGFKSQDKLKSIQFASFFVPYAICLFYETRAVIMRLRGPGG